MSQLDSFSATQFVERAKPTLANILSVRFSELRELVLRELNQRDRAALCLISHSLNFSIHSRNHIKPLAPKFSRQCDVTLFKWAVVVYGASFNRADFRPCTNQVSSRSILRICEGPTMLKSIP